MTEDPLSDNGPAPIDAQFEPAPDTAPSPAPRAPGWAALGAMGLISALIGAAAGAYGARLLPAAPGANAEVKQLEKQVADLAEAQARIDEALSKPAAASAELAGLIAELDTLSQRLDLALAAGGDPEALGALTARIDALESRRAEPPAPDPQVAFLTERLRNIETERQADAAQAKAAEEFGNRAEAALALSAIEAATRRGAGFEADYRALRKALPANESVKRLAPYVTGVPALAALQAEFPAIRAAVIDAATPEPSARLSWVDRVFGDAVSVRPAAGKHSETSKALDQASAALSAGDLSGAVRALARLDAEPARAAEDWTRRANRRITLEEALEDVRLSLAEGED